jgi:hypothetical protein
VVEEEGVEDEYTAFTAQSPIDVQSSRLNWWLRDEQRRQWPKLSKMAIDILSIPAMSDEPERVFLECGGLYLGIERDLEHRQLRSSNA